LASVKRNCDRPITRQMDAAHDSDLPALRYERRISVPISFSGDIAGFLYDLLSDLDAIVWEADAETFTVEFISDRARDLLGHEPVDMIAVPSFWSETIVHPGDREAFVASEREVLRRGVSRLTYRAVGVDGSVVWLASVARLVIDQEGRRRVRGLETDVTAIKRAEEQARESEQRFRLLSEASRDSVIVRSGDAIVEVNQAFCDQFGWSPGEALQLQPADYLAADSIALVRRRAEPGPVGPVEVIGRHRSGVTRCYSAQSREARFDGRPAQVVVLTDITDLKRREERALHDATHDALTGLPNRAALERRLEEELARRSPDHLLGLLFCDLNRFKDVNDTHGHAAGDSLLRLAAQRLTSVVRTSDPVFRLGGDEFVILLPRLAVADAERVVELMRRRLAGVFGPSFSIGLATVRVGLAVGTAMCPTHGTTADALVAHADVAMYADKRAAKAA
jgi:diguanylate cyclase (GGDEF)-like protein/PAS domain S-box-containing protein